MYPAMPNRTDEDKEKIREFCEVCSFYKPDKPCYVNRISNDMQLENAEAGLCGWAKVRGVEGCLYEDRFEIPKTGKRIRRENL